MSTLNLSRDLRLPVDTVTQTIAILAKKRRGKTYTASVLAEEFVKASLPFVAIDPTGAWWGLRASADGKKAGFPVVVIGGDHGDLPLDPHAGAAIADLVVEHPGWYVLDLSQTNSNADQDRFATDFAERLYRAKASTPHRTPMHLFVDEADAFVPQSPMPGQQRMLGAFDTIVRRGGIRGIGVTMISQRPAVVSKNVLSQCELLLALQIVGAADRDAIDAWVKGHGSREQRDELLSSLASLGLGEAWAWSPSWLGIFKRVQVRERETFNSSKTPESGESRVEPKALAPVDIERIREQFTAIAETAKADDPKALRTRIAQLEREIADAVKTPARPTTVEVPAVSNELRRQLEEAAESLRVMGGSIVAAADRVTQALAVVGAPAVTRPAADAPAKTRRSPPSAQSMKADPPEGIGKGELRMLHAIARRHPAPLSREQLGVLSGYASSGGTFRTYLPKLVRAGVVSEDRDGVRLTEAGKRAAAGVVGQVAAASDVRAMWQAALGAGEWRMLEVLIDEYPRALSRTELGELSGYAASGGTFRTYLPKLKRLALVDERGDSVVASEVLFDG